MAQSLVERESPRRVSSLGGFCRGMALGACSMGLLAGLTAGAYVAKSAAGIDLIEGHSPLHAPLWPVAKELRAVWREVSTTG
ncbi:MAG: hypothetical protein AAFR75_04605 [Pseudomonadota bacterium]